MGEWRGKLDSSSRIIGYLLLQNGFGIVPKECLILLRAGSLMRFFFYSKWNVVFAFDAVAFHLRTGSKVQLSDGTIFAAYQNQFAENRLNNGRAVTLEITVYKSRMVGIYIHVLQSKRSFVRNTGSRQVAKV